MPHGSAVDRAVRLAGRRCGSHGGGRGLVVRSSERNGVPTHYVGGVDDVTFRARDVEMIPLELVARRYATGSYRDRFPDLADGEVLEELVFEIFEKDDVR